MAFIFTACSSNNAKNETTKDSTTTTKEVATTPSAEQLYACSMHSEVIGKKGDKCSKCGMELTVPVKKTVTPIETKPTVTAQNSNATINEVIASYLKLKNALTKDDTKEAANAGNSIVAVLGKLDIKNLSKEQMKSYMDVADDTKENAEHIGTNAGKLDHQREHFAMLSKDVNDLIKPARIMIESHIKNGKENLNFSEFGNYSKRKQINKLSRIVKQIKANEMPLPSYTFLHSNAKINANQKQALISWADSLSN